MRQFSKTWVLIVLVTTWSFYLFIFQSGESGTRLNQDQTVYDIQEEIIKLKTEFPYLWRPSGGDIIDVSTFHKSGKDRVHELQRWIQTLVKSKFLLNSRPKRILVFEGFSNYYGTNGEIKCPFLTKDEHHLLKSKCLITEAKPISTNHYDNYDAFVSVRNWKPVVFDQRISSVQHVYYIEESPYVTRYAHLGINDAILASYWRGADIVLPYGYFFRRRSNSNFNLKNSTRRNYADGKTKLAAIIVSNCNAINDRLRYVQELEKYVKIDVYGACGVLKCGGEECFNLVKKEYKFYLAFEKASCRDYITEKFWNNGLRYDAVPIVMGAHMDDYRSLAPPHSYIHIEDFKSPKNLANYLKLLDSNDTLYNEYFKYKDEGYFENIWEQFFCRLCSLLHYGDIIKPPKWKQDASWSSVNHCLEPGEWYWKNKR